MEMSHLGFLYFLQNDVVLLLTHIEHLGEKDGQRESHFKQQWPILNLL